ncbi:plexin-B-like [Acanthaster planci]|uniref:Plexin-B-like n=1 Tax=Acanthaster planci TaxID=133434 RepID=A0A8B8A0P6_ACAPL|nr:plexin-B-like [Acanthaster planci]
MPITLAGQQMIVTLQKLPQLHDGHHYVCRFGDIFDYQATNYNKDSLACRTPPQDNLPPLPTGEDHVIVSLSVMSMETGVNFVSIDLSFYECGTHTSCVSCVGSDWACNWCVYENRCTHNDSICSKPNEIIVTGQYNRGTTMDGPDACPQLQPQNGEVLIPNNVNTEITVNVSNFPLSTMLSRYQCSLNIEGVDQFVEATRDDSTVACTRRSFTYTSIEQELNATLSIWWTDDNNNIHRVDDRHGFTVTLYKCEVLRPDCSRCVSEETTRAELGCVWCGNTCGVLASAVCETAAEIVNLHNEINCPDPVIMMIYPLFGPDEGNTIITVMASDLGRRFSDLREVTIGGQICDFHDLEMYYRTGASVHCRTRSSYDLRPQLIQASITGANGIEQRSHGEATFRYKV